MIVKILGSDETVEIPDEPHPSDLEEKAFDQLVRRALVAANSPAQPSDPS